MTRVLVTGGTGFLAGHVIDVLLKRGYSVVTTVRSKEKAQTIRDVFQGVDQQKLDFAIVPDISAKDAFQGLDVHGLEAAIHVASPFHYNPTDPKKDFIDPAVLGTTSILEALHKNCPTVRRVVVTSSFAAMQNPRLSSAGIEKTYTEADWSPLTVEDAYKNIALAYATSKACAERAAWEFIPQNKPNFSLTAINPPMIYGPVIYPVKSLDSVNTSNQLLANVISGKHKNGLPPTARPLWVDVRDVALAHVKAIEVDEAAGKRFFVCAGHWSNENLYRVLFDNFPDLCDRLPDEANKGGKPLSSLKSFGYDTTQATTILGLEWTPLEKTIIDSAKSLLKRAE
ncbi:methylglyoxal reductase (NADPH-dependent) gre2 [Fusarium torreyae]|uniref:Methylglyoxal reductase (NADPH-dependent) gre2 n=1 Tax=Fusarium torreyae TaxID=1237075 RepID=A0A9W8RXR6_9HYPO|nr:methylglyoxal reductase (NADPH-dependent) gre2 [Fusarium torreyae]